MVGGAAESTILALSDIVVCKVTPASRTVPRDLNDWRPKVVTEALRLFLDLYKAQFGRELREPFEAYWAAFAAQIRITRNDAGHPISVEPVTTDTVHASLLVFPELAKL